MSVWSDMGLVEGRMNGVDPCVFLDTALAFFEEVRFRTLENYRRNEGSFGLRLMGLGETYTRYFSCFDAYFPERRLGMPVPERFWEGTPVWSTVFGLGEAGVLEEDVLFPPDTRYFRVTDPAWPLQRYRLIQRMRYLTVPAEVRILKGYDGQWYAGGGGALDHWYLRGWWYEAYDRPFYWEPNGSKRIRVRIPEYWTRENTVCRIGFEVEKINSGTPDPPISGCFWHRGNEYLSAEYAGPEETSCYMRGFGVADLSTHPDFAQYFDID